MCLNFSMDTVRGTNAGHCFPLYWQILHRAEDNQQLVSPRPLTRG